MLLIRWFRQMFARLANRLGIARQTQNVAALPPLPPTPPGERTIATDTSPADQSKTDQSKDQQPVPTADQGSPAAGPVTQPAAPVPEPEATPDVNTVDESRTTTHDQLARDRASQGQASQLEVPQPEPVTLEDEVISNQPDEFVEAETPARQDRVATAYSSALEFLLDELARVALLVKAYTIRRAAADKACRSPLEVVTQIPFTWDNLPTEATWVQSYRDHLHEENQLQEFIAERLKQTPSDLTERFPLMRLLRILESDTGYVAHSEDRSPIEAHLRLAWLQREVLLLAFLDDHFPVYRGTFARLSTEDGTAPGGLTVAMAAEICQPIRRPGDEPLALFQDDVPLIQGRYVEIGDDSVEASRRRLRIDPAIVSYLLERDFHDAEQLGYVTRYAASYPLAELLIDASPLEHLETLSERINHNSVVTLLHGPAGGPFISAARAVLTDHPCSALLAADLERAASLPNFAAWTSRVYRQARLEGLAILWSGATALLDTSRTDVKWQQLLRPRSESPIFITAETPWDPEGLANLRLATFVRIEIPIASREVRQHIWQRQLAKECVKLPAAHATVTLELLASFQFTEGQVTDAIVVARGLAMADPSDEPDMAEHLYDACRRVSARGLVSFTQRIPPRKFGNLKNPIDAVILAPEAHQQLQELDERIRNLNRVYYEYGFGNTLSLGRGLIALFSGPSGTGKTMAASALASSREKDLYKVDMSAIVSKYVGETEKNLSRVFSDAQRSSALLFFDEADAIFGKRGEVDKAQDRWANMEINYLLQRVEEFSGVVILATNLKQNMDDAFLRRVQVLIDFKPPDAKSRQKILKGMFPDGVLFPNDDDLKSFCEQFEDLTGGNLKNVAVDAAFRALHELQSNPKQTSSTPLQIKIEHLVAAAAREFRKLSRPVSLEPFGRRFFDMLRDRLRLD